MGEEIFDGDLGHGGVHLGGEIGEELGHGGLEGDFFVVDELADEEGGHRLGVGAEVDDIGFEERGRVADLAQAGATEGDDFIAVENGGDEAGKFVFFGEGAKGGGEIEGLARAIIKWVSARRLVMRY